MILSILLEDLLMRLDFRDPEPDIIDLSPEDGTVATLKESQVECLTADKVSKLYIKRVRMRDRLNSTTSSSNT